MNATTARATATASRVARNVSFRWLPESARSMASSSSIHRRLVTTTARSALATRTPTPTPTPTPNPFSSILPQGYPQQEYLAHRTFATESGNGGGDKDKDKSESDETTEIPPIVVDLESNSDSETMEYDPFEITKSFEDTSYYYPPSEEMTPQFLAAKYQGMTNEELLDSSTIPSHKDPHTDVTHTWDSLMHSPPIRDKNAQLPKGTLVGTVVSTKMQKTVNVAVDRYKVHPKYRKRIRYTRKFMAHDEHEVASDGDLVLIVPSQKISKKKHFVLREILKAKGQL